MLSYLELSEQFLVGMAQEATHFRRKYGRFEFHELDSMFLMGGSIQTSEK